MPIIVHREYLREIGIEVHLFKDDCIEFTECDVTIVESKYLSRMHGKSNQEKHDFFFSLRDRNDNLIFADIQDSSGWDCAPMLPAVKIYAKSQILSDRNEYLRPIFSFRLFCEYFRDLYDVEDTGEYSAPVNNPKDLDKLCVLWNSSLADYRWMGPYRMISYGKLPVSPLLSFPNVSDFTSPNAYRPVDVTCRVGTTYHRQSITKHRRHALLELKKHIHIGKLPRKKYIKELRLNKISVSPFGYGETTLRDFETILAGAMLMKPDMSHFETWPNLYRAHHSYVPFKWDMSDLVENVELMLNDTERRHAIAESAQEIYKEHICSKSAGELFSNHFKEILLRAYN